MGCHPLWNKTRFWSQWASPSEALPKRGCTLLRCLGTRENPDPKRKSHQNPPGPAYPLYPPRFWPCIGEKREVCMARFSAKVSKEQAHTHAALPNVPGYSHVCSGLSHSVWVLGWGSRLFGCGHICSRVIQQVRGALDALQTFP